MSPAPRASRKSRRISPYSSPHPLGRTSVKTSEDASASRPLISLEAFLSNLVFGIAIQDDEDIAEIVFNRDFSRGLDETANGTPLDFQGMKEFTANLRRDLSDRRLVSESFVVMPADPGGQTGTVAHSFQFTANQAEGVVKASVVAVVNVGLNKKQQRQIKMESFVFRTDNI